MTDLDGDTLSGVWPAALPPVRDGAWRDGALRAESDRVADRGDRAAEQRIGPPPGSGRKTLVLLAGGSVALLVVAMVTILVAGLSFWRSSEPVPADPAAKSYSGTLAVPLRIVPVTGVTPGGCADGGTPGRTVADGCFTLGTGGMTVLVVERVNTALRNDKWLVDVRFSSDDTVALRALSTQNVGKRLALVVEGTVLTAPAVAEPITDGSLRITGDFTQKDVDAIFGKLADG
jgi:SecD-like export protein